METQYPFRDQINVTIKNIPQKEKLLLRVPSWCTNPQCTVNGKAYSTKWTDGNFIVVSRKWKSGDRICLTFPMKAELKEDDEQFAKYKDKEPYWPHGFTLKKPTAHKLIERASLLLENLYKCTAQTVLRDNYISADETYYKILVREKNGKGRGVRKGYLWVILGMRSKLLYVLYQDGSRSEDVILRELEDYRGVIQSDGYSPYRKLQKEGYPHIMTTLLFAWKRSMLLL